MRALIFAAALTVLAGPVYAQNAGSFSGSNAGSASQSSAGAAGGSAGATINYSVNDPGLDPNANYQSTQTIRNNTQAPDVVVGGANSCATPIGASTSVLGFGFGLAATPVDKGCERRDDAAALHALGHDDVAIGIMCESQDVADAMSATGHQCPQAGAPTSPPVAATQPIPTGDINANLNNEVSTLPPPAPVADYVSSHRAWCRSLNPADPRERPYIQYDCGGQQ